MPPRAVLNLLSASCTRCVEWLHSIDEKDRGAADVLTVDKRCVAYRFVSRWLALMVVHARLAVRVQGPYNCCVLLSAGDVCALVASMCAVLRTRYGCTRFRCRNLLYAEHVYSKIHIYAIHTQYMYSVNSQVLFF